MTTYIPVFIASSLETELQGSTLPEEGVSEAVVYKDLVSNTKVTLLGILIMPSLHLYLGWLHILLRQLLVYYGV